MGAAVVLGSGGLPLGVGVGAGLQPASTTDATSTTVAKIIPRRITFIIQEFV